MRARNRRQRSLHEYYSSEEEDKDHKEAFDDLRNSVRHFNAHIIAQEAFAISRKIKTTKVEAGVPIHEALLSWERPQFNWCHLSKALCIR